ncbi:phosphatase PAP2 family protein [bacterium]|nr:phosphatase PAP2 family protein [bacterium]
MLLLFGAIFGFVELADEVLEGSTQSIDQTILLSLRSAEDPAEPIGPLWLGEVMRDLTALGGATILFLLSFSIVIYLMLQRRLGAMTFVIAAVVGGAVMSLILKELFGRPRPDLVTHLSYVTTSSFPSGHSMLAAVTYLTLGALLARIHAARRIKAFFLIVAVVLTVLVGFSRVYLGVHWPTDVLGGWTVGAAWAILCWFGARRLQERGQIENE